MISFTTQEFAWLQGFLNDIYQDACAREGPSGQMIVAVRNKFLVFGDVELDDVERRFLLYNVNDVFQTSHSPVVKPQISLQVSYVGDDDSRGDMRHIISQNQGIATIAPTHYPTWFVMKNIMTKLGIAPVPAATFDSVTTVDRSAEMNGPQPNVDPDERIGFTKNGERVL